MLSSLFLLLNFGLQNKENKMKSIDIKSMLIGVLTCSCLFLIMGQTNNNEKNEQMVKMIRQQTEVLPESGLLENQVGRYQVIAANKYEYFYLLDTETGAVYSQIENPEKNTYKKRLADAKKKSFT